MDDIPFTHPATAHPEQVRQYSVALRYAEAAYEQTEKVSLGKYVPPTSDDPADWKGPARWAALWQSFLWWAGRENDLRTSGPFYCPEHGEKKPGAGWFPRLCYDCAWVELLADEALSQARVMGREFQEVGA